MQPAASRHVYLNLDAIRGVAAISVMLYHFSPFLADGKVLPSSYLAVDLFFLLSGFVIAHAYDRKIENGMGFGTFLAIRLIRLYPLYLAGTLLGFFYLLIKNRLIATPSNATDDMSVETMAINICCQAFPDLDTTIPGVGRRCPIWVMVRRL